MEEILSVFGVEGQEASTVCGFKSMSLPQDKIRNIDVLRHFLFQGGFKFLAVVDNVNQAN